jgi:hypothetical protein
VPPAPQVKKRSRIAGLFVPRGQPGELVIVSHSNLFYWWPVWLLGFVMAGWSYYEGAVLASVPPGTEAARNRQVQVLEDGKLVTKERDVLVLPQGKSLREHKDAEGNVTVDQPHIVMAPGKDAGVIFVVVLLLVIAITNIPMRGLWSLLTILVLIMWAIIFAQLGLWDVIFSRSRQLSIHINLGGYLFISISLFIIWLIAFLFFDRQFYVIVTPGQLRVHLEIGGGEHCYDTVGMVFQKKRSDLFRHWVLGFGSGDLIIRPANSREHIDLPNVTFVTSRVRAIELRLKEREIVAG